MLPFPSTYDCDSPHYRNQDSALISDDRVDADGGALFLRPGCIGSWHGTESTKTCEMYDTVKNEWTMLPSLNDSTCAPGLIVMKDRYLYKLGGTSDIGKIEMLDL